MMICTIALFESRIGGGSTFGILPWSGCRGLHSCRCYAPTHFKEYSIRFRGHTSELHLHLLRPDNVQYAYVYIYILVCTYVYIYIYVYVYVCICCVHRLLKHNSLPTGYTSMGCSIIYFSMYGLCAPSSLLDSPKIRICCLPGGS